MVDKRVETAKSQSLICPPTNLFLSSLDDRNIIAQTGMVYHLCANQDLLKIDKLESEKKKLEAECEKEENYKDSKKMSEIEEKMKKIDDDLLILYQKLESSM